MELYGTYSKSILQKTIILTLEIALIVYSYYCLFGNGFVVFGMQPSDANINRRIIIFTFNVIVFLRILVTIFHLVKRKIPMEEAFSIPMAFALYYIGFVYFVYHSVHTIDTFDVFAVLLFLFGSYLNTGSELMRNKWKKNPENKGKLYTKGLFKYSMHINYFGDLLWVSAYAMITRNWYSIVIPVFLFCFFAFFNIPKLDKYLSEKYDTDFKDYKSKTKKFIPLIY
ncbi:MAG: DUF1295 domain-containing protein [Chlorobi bacterium]|nr:DUF1295 domain-containing protein [Chlorobiota bacterium]